ncbi:18106_t:CDS:1 [Acaulospora morrowiae]|uniref:18106_t:CDS:1 n=1 Tax=Acaulospora morrowiae TaxID=94023 RepID=A0A9N8Z5R5_9GLOM|nr:18106_t:CDS:1 [Acaulospora morrowiae]
MKTFENLPCECIIEIFLHFEDNYSTLHKCLFVNRFWCKLVVPILWRRPFRQWCNSFQRVEKRIESNWNSLCRTYIAALNEVEKEILTPFDKRHDFPQPLFQYSSYLEKFSFSAISGIIMEGWKINDMWINLFQDETIKRLRRMMTAILQLVLRTSHLREIEILDYYSTQLPFFYNVLNGIPFSSYQFGFSQLRSLTIHIKSSTNHKELLSNLSKSCTNIQSLEYKIERYVGSETIDALADIITTQSNLKTFSLNIQNFVYDQGRLINYLHSQKESLTSLSLQSINLSNVDLNKIAEYTKLETMEICNCYWNMNGSYEIFLRSPIQLKSLTFSKNSFGDNTFLAALIKKADKNLLNLCTDEVPEKIMKYLFQFCPNISKFTLFYKNDWKMFLHYLKGSRISRLVIKSHISSNKLLNILGTYVPSSLEELYLRCNFTPDYLRNFLLDYSISSSDTLETLYIKDIEDHSYGYLKAIEDCIACNSLKTIVLESLVYTDEKLDFVQNIRKKGINIILQETV